MRIVPMSQEHGSGVMDVFNDAILHGCSAFPENPLPTAAFDVIFKMTQGYPSLVLLDENDCVVGFAFLKPYNALPVFKRTAELSYFLSPRVQRMGFGSQMWRLLQEQGRACGVRNFIATIHSQNESSIAFHRKHGFRQCGQLTHVGERKGECFHIVLFEKEVEREVECTTKI